MIPALFRKPLGSQGARNMFARRHLLKSMMWKHNTKECEGVALARRILPHRRANFRTVSRPEKGGGNTEKEKEEKGGKKNNEKTTRKKIAALQAASRESQVMPEPAPPLAAPPPPPGAPGAPAAAGPRPLSQAERRRPPGEGGDPHPTARLSEPQV